ncbi:MAG: peptidase T [Clostridiales bacterium]|nr:peptidase T [Clostridiales bacterium]
MRAYERLLRYIQYGTASDAASDTCPSTPGQLVLAGALVDEMRAMGMRDARVDEHGYVYGSIPANAEGQPAIGLIAHLDTVDGVPCLPMNARVLEKYDGGDIALDNGMVMRAAEYPALAECVGDDLIVTDGRTILGADDKAGVAEIMTACERLLADPSVPHGKVLVAFTPDEEIGRGADQFDVAGFGADFAYTVDGGLLGEIEYENFNAAGARVEVTGFNIHPGSAKDKMRNASLMAMAFHAMLPAAEAPAHTEGYEGFYHLTSMKGDEESALLTYIVRDHDRARFEARKDFLRRATAYMNGRWGEGSFRLELKDSYYNMKEQILPHMHIVRRAEAAMRAVGCEPRIIPIRGGTDGSRLSYMGLPCPNLSTGAMNGHGRFECASVRQMDSMVEVLLNIVRADARQAP